VLSTRLVKPPPDKCVTRIYPLKRQAESFNAAKMKGLKGEEHEFVHAFHTLKRLSDQEQAYLEKQLLNAPCEPRIVLKVGAVVMQIVNSTPDGASFRKVNGSLGVVEDFDASTNNPIVRFSYGDLCEGKPYTWVTEDKRLSRSQIPLIIAWAVTAHKIQGASLDAAVMSLGSNVFEDNQAYVMLSRVKTLEGVFLSSFDPSVIRAHPDAVAYYKMLDNHNNSGQHSNINSEHSEQHSNNHAGHYVHYTINHSEHFVYYERRPDNRSN
jgi:ATP-dependent DNA helicase PIF1